MDEYASIAQRVVLTMDDVRGCLVLSRDGLVLGAFPEDEEAAVKPAWLKFTHVGDARRSFVEFSDQIWAYIHRGPYAAFVLAGTAARPGVLLDQLEQSLLIAEETRAKRETLKVPDAAAAPSGRPRTSLHPPTGRPQTVEAGAVPAELQRAAEAPAQMSTGPWKRPIPAAEGPKAGGGGGPTEPKPVGAEATHTPLTSFRPPSDSDAGLDLVGGLTPAFQSSPFAEILAEDGSVDDGGAGEAEGPGASGEGPGSEAADVPVFGDPAPSVRAEETSEIDRVMLAKEFSGLLQLDADDDEARS